MVDLLDIGAEKGLSYTAKDIEVLEGLEPVRRRPGMYIGGTDEFALHHLAAEILDNAMDEAVAGYASVINMSLDADGRLTISDNGRGIPIDAHPKFPGKSALEVIMTTLHSGGKFGGSAYKVSGGLHGVGLSVVNALASELVIEVARNKKLYRQKYSRGVPLTPLEEVGKADKKSPVATELRMVGKRVPTVLRSGRNLHFHVSRSFLHCQAFCPVPVSSLPAHRSAVFRQHSTAPSMPSAWARRDRWVLHIRSRSVIIKLSHGFRRHPRRTPQR